MIEESLASGKPIVRRSLRLDSSTSTASHLGVTVSPIRSTGGALQGAICLFSDLSEVAELEEQLRLKDSLARLGELTAGIAHEFRNGLATIHGYARLLDLDRLPEEFRPYVTGIRAETEALRQVVTQFLNFAKPAELALARVDVGGLAERAAEEIRTEARARGGRVEVRGQFGAVDGDEVLLRQAFSNLCRNALEACTGAATPPHIMIEGTRRSRAVGAAHRRHRQWSRHRRSRRRAHVPAVLHHEGERHRARPCPGPEDHRDAQRPRRRVARSGPRRPCGGDAAAAGLVAHPAAPRRVATRNNWYSRHSHRDFTRKTGRCGACTSAPGMRGMTLIEVAIATGLIAVIALGVAPLLAIAVRTNAAARLELAATAAATNGWSSCSRRRSRRQFRLLIRSRSTTRISATRLADQAES